MGNGKVKEFDQPQALMANPSSHFAKLIEEVTMEEERIKQEREEKELKEAEEKNKKDNQEVVAQ
jgi:ABC-type proline/glycine betaine transport system ATPase subunit